MKEVNKPIQDPALPRRQFLGDTVKLAVLGTILVPIQQACNNKKDKGSGTGTTGNNKDKKTTRVKKNRKKWLKESLVVNTKTQVIHFPSSKIYHYYDEIKEKNLSVIGLGSINSESHLNKAQSGNILEYLSMKPLTAGANDENLTVASQTLAMAFGENCNNSKNQNMNERNFRLHELMLQLVTLNTGIPVEGKWQAFNSKVRRPAELRKRQQWMATETAFNERVKYILDRRADYEGRLVGRSRKYSFT